MAYVGEMDGVGDWVGGFVGVIEGDGVGLRVGKGVTVSAGTRETLGVEVSFDNDIVAMSVVTIGWTAPTSV